MILMKINLHFFSKYFSCFDFIFMKIPVVFPVFCFSFQFFDDFEKQKKSFFVFRRKCATKPKKDFLCLN